VFSSNEEVYFISGGAKYRFFFFLSVAQRDQGRLRIVTFLTLVYERKIKKNVCRHTSTEFLHLLNPKRDENKLETLSAPSKTG